MKTNEQEAQLWREAGANRTAEDIAASREKAGQMLEKANKEARERKNAARRARHQAYLDCGMKRVKGSLGGTYYE